MPDPDPVRRDQPASDRAAARVAARTHDLSAIPAFLRAGAGGPSGEAETNRSKDAPAAAQLAIPRPATPKAAIVGTSTGARTIDPATLPMPSLSRRRVITAAGFLLAGLLSLTFAQQVGEASAASQRADDLRAANAALRDEVERLERDLNQVQDPRFIALEGRAFGLGGRKEIPFALAAGAPPLAADAPGSASVRLGADHVERSPLDAWLDVLFGEDR
jgi:hypothetical protein